LKRYHPLPRLAIDRASRDPLHRQLADALRRAIRGGDLPPGAALPSTRGLAKALGVSRNTAITAYEELAAEGLLAARAGSATRVCGSGRAPAPDWRGLLRGSHFPAAPFHFQDRDGNGLYFHD